MRLVAGVLHITGVASNCYAGDKMVCMQINTKSQNIVIIRQYSAKITLRSNTYDEFSIPFTIPSGYKFVGIVRAWVTNEEIVTVNAYTKTVSSTDVTMSLFNKSSNAITASSYINLLFLKD